MKSIELTDEEAQREIAYQIKAQIQDWVQGRTFRGTLSDGREFAIRINKYTWANDDISGYSFDLDFS